MGQSDATDQIWPNTPDVLSAEHDLRNVGPGDLVNELADRAAAWASHPSYGYTKAQLDAFQHHVWSRLHDALYHTEVPPNV